MEKPEDYLLEDGQIGHHPCHGCRKKSYCRPEHCSKRKRFDRLLLRGLIAKAAGSIEKMEEEHDE